MPGIVFFIYIAFSIFLGLCYLSARRGRRTRCLVFATLAAICCSTLALFDRPPAYRIDQMVCIGLIALVISKSGKILGNRPNLHSVTPIPEIGISESANPEALEGRGRFRN